MAAPNESREPRQKITNPEGSLEAPICSWYRKRGQCPLHAGAVLNSLASRAGQAARGPSVFSGLVPASTLLNSTCEGEEREEVIAEGGGGGALRPSRAAAAPRFSTPAPLTHSRTVPYRGAGAVACTVWRLAASPPAAP